MTIELVVFDLAGTTVDDGDAVNRCLRASLAAHGFEADREAVNEVMGLPKPVAIRALIDRRAGGEGAGVAEAIYADFVPRMVRCYEDDRSVAEFEGTTRAFEALRRENVKVALDTGFSRAVAAAVIDRMGWERAGLIDASITSDEVERGRPHPDMILALMRRLGVRDARAVAKVGDTPSDLEEGTNAGCGRVIGVTGGTHTREQLARCPHTDLVPTVGDLPALLGLDPSR